MALPQTQRLADRIDGFFPLNRTDISQRGKVQFGLLCQRCKAISSWLETNWNALIEAERQWPELEHHESGKQLEQSYKAGCHLCTHFLVSLVDGVGIFYNCRDDYSNHDTEKQRRKNLRKVRDGGRVSVLISYDSQDSIHFQLRAQVQVSGVLPDQGKKVLLGAGLDVEPLEPYSNEECQYASLDTSISSAVGSSTVTEFAKYWLQDCIAQHSACHQRIDVALPTRLLEICKTPRFENDSQIHVRLVETKSLPEELQVRYASLSYCWGGSSGFKLTQKTQVSLASGVTIEILPRTIGDAVQVTANLDIRWMWVDTLCILQDSVDDWKREANLMCDVYRGSLLTLEALSASKNTDGLFTHRDPLMYAACPLFALEDDVVSVFAAGHDSGSLLRGLEEWPLYQRGWVVQERLLPSRHLRFGPYLEWECCEGYIREFEFGRRSGNLSIGRLQQTLFGDSKHHAAPDAEEIRLHWESVAKEFSKAKLTVKTDRLMAFMGITTAVARSTGWKSLAGFWEPLVVTDLLWHTERMKHGLVQRSGHRPYWSWISLDGRVSFSPGNWSYGEDTPKILADLKVVPDIGTILPVSTAMPGIPAVQLSCAPIRSFTLRFTSDDLKQPGYYVYPANWEDTGLQLWITLDDQSSHDVPTILLVLVVCNAWISGIAVAPSQIFQGAYDRVGHLRYSSTPGDLRRRFQFEREATTPREDFLLV